MTNSRKKKRASRSPTSADVRVAGVQIDNDDYVVISIPVPESPQLAKLSPAEQDVLRYVMEGCTNLEIGRRRGTSPRTVANQVASILRKLGVSSRGQIASYLASLERG